MKMNLPEDVNFIIHKLYENGFEAYAVGGCVRDTILGREPKDWDITTSAKPNQVKELFDYTIDTGIEHGTVTVMLNHVGYEVTTYRIDGEYEDNRHPKEVIFTSNLVEDLKRRDFTINAMAYNEREGLIDVFGGEQDLKDKLVRCVGTAEDRFGEDALRMLRAVRFAAQLGFEIVPETAQAIKKLAPTIEHVSAERIQVEMVKLLTSSHPEEIRTTYELGLTKVFLPEFDVMMGTPQVNKHHAYSVGEHTIVSLQNVEPDKVLRLALLLHDVAKPVCKTVDDCGQEHYYGHPGKSAEMAKTILRRLKFDNKTIDVCTQLIKYHDERPQITEKSIRKAISKIGVETIPDLLKVKRADCLGQSMYRREEKLQYIDEFQKMYEQILEKKQCVQKKDMKINGRDLINIGMKPGKELGLVLDELFDMVIENPGLNTHEKLIELAHKKANPLI